mgnify:CR=1 FL=1
MDIDSFPHPSSGRRLRAVPPLHRQRRVDPRHALDADDRALRRRVLAHSLQEGRPLSADAVTAVLAAKAWRDELPELYTEATVRELLWVDILVWCEAHELELPLDAPEALWSLLVVLHADGALHPRSDSLEVLRRPLLDCGGLTPTGHRQPNLRSV